MGFTSLDDLMRKVSSGNTYRCDWQRMTPDFGAGVVGSWADSYVAGGGNPIAGHGTMGGHGNIVKNATLESYNDWNPSPDWTIYDDINNYTALRHPIGQTSSIWQTIPLISGVSYTISYVLANTSGSGSITLDLGGT